MFPHIIMSIWLVVHKQTSSFAMVIWCDILHSTTYPVGDENCELDG